MKKRKFLLAAFVIFTAANIFIYIKRDHFAYRLYPSYSSLYSPCQKDCKERWRQFAKDYPAGELEATIKMTDSLLSLHNRSSLEKILLIGNFLRSRFHLQEGSPSALLSSASPFGQFKLLSTNKDEKLWCGNYANMMAWFCRSQGISTRIVEIIKPGDHHVINECYLPEKGKWMMVDLTHNLLGVENEKQEPLHVIGLLEKKSIASPFLAYRSVDDSITRYSFTAQQFPGSNYFQKEFSLYYYKRINLEKVYSTSEKIKRYVLPQSWYSIYEPAGGTGNNLLYFIKLFFICSWLIIIFALAGLFLSSRKRIS
ncbi:MAG TPA: transglutaminase domain-containing protein [Chitinophagaceae bacterium]